MMFVLSAIAVKLFYPKCTQCLDKGSLVHLNRISQGAVNVKNG